MISGAAQPSSLPVSGLSFRHPWRPYQARVLQAFDRHIQDRHFHVVAAPGAGKTVLGLEAMRRLATPSLILAPTLAIRDQWQERWRCDFGFADDGFNGTEHADWLSTDIDRPGAITLTTYQGLHAASKRLGIETVIARLRAAGIGCLLLDEAHHLRAAWWRCLDGVKSGLEAPWMIALTATPPWDVPAQEWNRYLALCGAVDEEVSVPELVRAGTLSPHQDFLHLCLPMAEHQRHRQAFDRQVSDWVTSWLLDRDLILALSQLPVVKEPGSHRKLLLEQHDWALALTIFLSSAAGEHAVSLRTEMSLSETRLPPFDARWAELLMDRVLGTPQLLGEAHPWATHWRRELTRGSAFERGRVFLRAPPHLVRQLETSASKIDAIAELIEHCLMKDGVSLRAAILCDRIIESALPRPGEPSSRHRLGVAPVFEALRQRRLGDARLAMVSGTLMALPSDSVSLLMAELSAAEQGRVGAEALAHDPSYSRLTLNQLAPSALIRAFTRLLASGEINVLIGTTALLGEGWDAPALNTLIIASTAAASMSCNQMRGRALRLDPQRPHKVARIWHLACVEMGSHPSAATAVGSEVDALRRRFLSFSGLHHDGEQICNGLARLSPQTLPADPDALSAFNQEQRRRAADSQAIARDWRAALGDPARGDYALRTERIVSPRRLPRSTLLRWLPDEPVSAWLAAWADWLRRRQLRRLAELLLAHLRLNRQISESPDARVKAWSSIEGLRCRLDRASRADTARFDAALQELLGLPQRPRYLIAQDGRYFPLPKTIAATRPAAEQFAHDWRTNIGRCQLLSTRKAKGQSALLAAKEAWLLSGQEAAHDVHMRWSANG